MSAVLVGVMLSSCAAAPFLIPAGIEFARNLLITSNKNYGSRYSGDMNQMLVRLTTPYVQMGYPGQPGMAPAGGMPSPPYPGAPSAGYPGPPGPPGSMSPGYPVQPTIPGQYDPNNPYSAMPGSGYPGQPGYPGGPAPGTPSGAPPMPGYPPQPGAGAPYDPNNPYAQAPGAGFPGQPGYPGSAMPGSPYGSPPVAGGYPPQPGQPGYQGSGMPGSPYGSPPVAGGYPPQPGQPGYQGSGMPGSPYGSPPMAGGYPPQPGSPYGSYPGQGIYPRSIPNEPIALDVALLRQTVAATGKQVMLMKDGETLKDGSVSPQSGDKFKLVFRTNCECFVYIISIDGSGWAESIFPSSAISVTNPVKKDQEYAFPEGPNWFTLDQYRGIETMILVVSPVRRVDLEESLTQLAKAARPRGSVSAQVEEPPIIPNGFGKTQSGQATTVRSATGQQVEVTPLTYIASKPGEEVRVTRWFKHE